MGARVSADINREKITSVMETHERGATHVNIYFDGDFIDLDS